jgi:chemotaxis protein CheX
MDMASLGGLVRTATCDVFSTMLSLELAASPPFANPKPLFQSDVTALIGIAGDRQGFVAIHCTHVQARDFTARLLGMEREDVTDAESILDAVGELVNMVAGNVKSGYAPAGTLAISLPTVVMTPKSEVRVRAGASTVVEFDGSVGLFRVEVMLTERGGGG